MVAVDRPIALMLIEDDETVRQNLGYLLELNGFKLSGSFVAAEHALAALEQAASSGSPPVDIVLLDLDLPGMSGVDAIREMRRRALPVAIVVLTVFDDRDILFAALKAGASGYILKDTPLEDLCRGLLDVMRGGAPMSPAIARRVLQEFQQPAAEMDALTRRENEVLQLLIDGYRYEEIANRLSISSSTVLVHLRNIYRKLGVRSRSEAVVKALRTRSN